MRTRSASSFWTVAQCRRTCGSLPRRSHGSDADVAATCSRRCSCERDDHEFPVCDSARARVAHDRDLAASARYRREHVHRSRHQQLIDYRNTDAAELVRVQTIHDAAHEAGLVTATVNWPGTRGSASLDRNLPPTRGEQPFAKMTPGLSAELESEGISIGHFADWRRSGRQHGAGHVGCRLLPSGSLHY